jgi:APA family basic amino acid/polyamine antiporter
MQNSFSSKPVIPRKIGLVTAISIVVANMIGAGIFTTTGLMSSHLPGPGWVFSCWIFGGVLAIAGALCYAELATRIPEEGGEYVYLKKLFHPSLGFLTGWTSFFVGFSAPIAGSALGFSEYFFEGANLEEVMIDTSNLLLYKKLLAVTIILIFVIIHYMGIKLGSMVQNGLTILKILIILGLAILGWIIGKGNTDFFLVGNIESSSGFAFGTAMMLVMFSYSGWNASSYIAGELKNPQKTLPISLVMGTVIVIVLYLFINLFIFYALPYPELKGNIAVVEAAATKSFGNLTGNLFGLFVSLALLSSLSAYIIIGPRVYFAMACDRLFFPFASKVHSRFGVPGRSILIQGVIAIFMVLVSSLEQLLIYIEFALGIFPLFAVAGIYIARKRNIGEDSAFRVWGYPVIPVFFLICSLFLLIIAYMNRPLESTAAVITILVGIPLYYVVVKLNRRQVKK